MSSLYSLLGFGSNTISTFSSGIAVSGNNAANVDTEGYSRQRVDLRSEPGRPLVGGVRAGAVYRYESLLLSGRLRHNGAAMSASTTQASALGSLEAGLAGNDLEGSLGGFFGAMSSLTASPLDPFARTQAIQSADDLAGSFRRHAETVARSRQESDMRIREYVAKVTELAATIAEANRQAGVVDDPVLHDKRDAAAAQLSEMVGGNARVDSDGQMRFVLDDGAVLVDGTNAAAMTASTDTSLGGFARLDITGGTSARDVTSSITAGVLGGELAFRDQTGADAAAKIDQLAFDFATAVNAAHSANAGTDGVSGRNLFGPPAGVAGAAANLEVDPAVLADPDILATADPAAGAGSNAGALALAALADAQIASGGTRTLVDESISISSDVGRAASAANQQAEILEATYNHLMGLQDAVSGVSIQEELTRLTEFQHGIEAATKFVRTVDDLLGGLINTL